VRLPGKTLTDVGGRPLIAHVLDRLALAEGLDELVVATSTLALDDAIADWCAARGMVVFRGDADDVGGRVLAAAQAHGLDALARVNGDSPWLDPTLLTTAVRELREGDWDLVTNLLERTYPYGVAVEVMRTAALEAALAGARPEEREHVTKPFYRDPGGFSILNLRSDGLDSGDLRLTVDTEADLERFTALVARLGPRSTTAPLSEVIANARRLD
jgi:spore coat polysaccharide biosynthesis protein SpsF